MTTQRTAKIDELWTIYQSLSPENKVKFNDYVHELITEQSRQIEVTDDQ